MIFAQDKPLKCRVQEFRDLERARSRQRAWFETEAAVSKVREPGLKALMKHYRTAVRVGSGSYVEKW